MKQYLILLLAIICEVVATSALKQTEQFTRLVPSLITLAGYAGAFYFLSMVLRSIPLGIAYAIWSGAGRERASCWWHLSVGWCSSSILTFLPSSASV